MMIVQFTPDNLQFKQLLFCIGLSCYYLRHRKKTQRMSTRKDIK